MAHESEGVRRLKPAITTVKSEDAVERLMDGEASVWLFVLPSGRAIADSANSDAWHTQLKHFANSTNKNSIVAILTSPQDAAEMLPAIAGILTLQLWVAVKVRSGSIAESSLLAESHAALLILSRYTGSLRHTKTRIAYTYCPFCDKTTKDYGGKKHTYHEYGTLMSDVWRDIQIDPDELPESVIDRLADLFGLLEYNCLHVVDLRTIGTLRPAMIQTTKARLRRGKNDLLSSQLIEGDLISELRKLPASTVDFCFADPPYNLDKRYDIWDDALDVSNYLDWCSEWILELARVVRPGGTCAVLNIPSIAVKHFHQMKAAGLVFQNWIVWEGLSLPVRMIMPAHYSIVCFSKGPPRPLPGFQREVSQRDKEALLSLKECYCIRQNCVHSRKVAREADRESISDLWWDVHRLKHNSRRVDHPCQLPPALMFRLIALFTNPNEIVLDPFNGAGTTSLCADLMGRRYIGIELSEKYHEIASSRHRVLKNGGDPFAKGANVPKAKNSRVKRIGGIRYEVPKKKLQLEVKRIAAELQRMPTRDDLEKLSIYPIRMFDEYFINWGEVCAAARTTGMTETRETTNEPRRPVQGLLFE